MTTTELAKVEAEEPAAEETPLPEGFGTDTCDGPGPRVLGERTSCGVRAWVWVTMPSGSELAFCGHHGAAYLPGLAAQKANVQDLTHLILEH